MPPTWYPTLLETMLIESIRSNVWREGGLDAFIQKVKNENVHGNVQVRPVPEGDKLPIPSSG